MKSYCQTDVGRKRNMNQDFVYASEQPIGMLPNLFIVADGMGGHNAGDYASRCAVETMVDYIENSMEKKPVRLLAGAVEAANTAICRKASEDRSMAGMGTTLVACCVDRDCLYVVNIGDSRLYLIDEEMDQITRDHSLVEEMVQRGELTSEQARTHPEKNVITRAVGVKNSLKPDFFDVGLHPGDRVLLCSDGLTNMVEDAVIKQLVRQGPDLEQAGRSLIDTANENGGSDNISVILLEPEI